MPSTPRRAARASASLALLTGSLLATTALADKVATLHARGPAPAGERSTMRVASEGGARGLGHEPIAENDVLQGEAAAGDKIGTSAGLVAVGKVTGADWVVEPWVQSSDAGTRVELKVCQVASGRIETLARDLDPKIDPLVQVREMLGLLLRPQGVGDDPLPWAAKAASPSASSATSAWPSPRSSPSALPTVAPRARWGEGGRVSVGALVGAGRLLARPDGAVGGRTLAAWSLHAGVALPERPWLELFGRLGALHGPGGALVADLGARAMRRDFGLRPLALGASATLGVFGAFGSGLVRPTFALEPTVSWAFGSWAFGRAWQVDALVPLRVAPGEGGALFWSGLSVAALARF